MDHNTMVFILQSLEDCRKGPLTTGNFVYGENEFVLFNVLNYFCNLLWIRELTVGINKWFSSPVSTTNITTTKPCLMCKSA